ncbi:MAG: cation:proton antiporter [Cytophagaceae bacterium]
MSLIIAVCFLLLFAYLFDITAPKTKIPSFIMLLVMGWIVQQVVVVMGINIIDLTPLLPILGNIGLILIVLEGSLELELNKNKISLIGKASLVALLPMLILSFSLAYLFQYVSGVDYLTALTNAIPFSIISSAIAIPSVKNFANNDREFVTYESNLSDIFGIILFNFVTVNEVIEADSFLHFFQDLAIILGITFVATVILSFLLSKINHHVKFLPIIVMIVLIYAISKLYHLPALIFIMLFGLFIGNLDEFKNSKLIQPLQPEHMDKEVSKFKELTSEATFLIRALFFLLFGFLIKTNELLNTSTIKWAVIITAGIFILRMIFLSIFKISLQPLLFIAPRGLISILLFLTIPLTERLEFNSKSLIIQVILMTAIMMMLGTVFNPDKKEDEKEKSLQ